MEASARTIRSIAIHPTEALKNLQIQKSLFLAIKEFLEHTTLHAYQYLVEPNRHWLEKLMWLCVQVVSITAAIYFLTQTWFAYTGNPTFTTLSSLQHPIWEIPFPAVSICNNNKISKTQAIQFARILSARTTAWTEKEILEGIRYLGRLYDFDNDNRDMMLSFQEVLDRFDINTTSGIFDVTKRMSMLTPTCDDTLVKCVWGGLEVNCSSIFETRKTSEGYCCTFNYNRPRDNTNDRIYKKSRTAVGTGIQLGLTVIINATVDDYFYPIRNSLGFSINVFGSYDYPDPTTGYQLVEYLGLGYELFFRLSATTLKSVESISTFTIGQRKCMFQDELWEQFAGHYSHSECLLKCKMRSVIALCKCVPFQFPMNFHDDTTLNVIQCNLQHIDCLNRYRWKWLTYKPNDDNTDTKGLEGELEDSLSCPQCRPLCSTTTYQKQSSVSKISSDPRTKPQWGLLSDMEDITNLSIVRVSYPSADSELYKKDLISTWYEILSNFGGMLGLCMGFSIITVIEIIYFLTVRFYQNLFSARNEEKEKLKIEKNKFEKNKFVPKPRYPNYKEIEIKLSSQFDDEKFSYLK